MSKSIQRIDNCINKIDQYMSESKISDEKDNKILMIPGPTEFDDRVYDALAQKTLSHVDPKFIKQFGNCINLVRKVLLSNSKTQPFILSGGGSVGWDCIVASLCYSEDNDGALILNTGYFGDNFRDCCKSYNIKTDEILAKIGDTIDYDLLIKKLKENKYKLICITHVDTSTGVCNNIEKISKIIKEYSPNSLIAVDGVCSFAAEAFRFDKWGIDAAMTASQKAFGVPPGLCIVLLSERATNLAAKNKNRIRSWYCNLARWLPIMIAYEKGNASYFSTPNVNLIQSLEVSLTLMLNEGMENVFKRSYKYSNAFKKSMKTLGLTFVPINDNVQANTLSAIRYPKNVDPNKFRGFCKEKGCIFAGGLHNKIKNEYFRVGHMGISMKDTRNDLLRCVKAIEYAMEKSGVNFVKGSGVESFKKGLDEHSNL